MRARRLVLPIILIASMAGCGSDDPIAMPDVTGQKLDVAYDKIKNAGFDDKDKVKVEGGGLFGVVVESNWTVCEQQPAAGKNISEDPSLIVDRSCDNDVEKTEEEPVEEPSERPTEEPTRRPTEKPSKKPATPKILTAKNSPEFAALLKLKDECSSEIAKFAKAHHGKTVRFDGAIVAMAPHGDYDTRFDFLVNWGDFDPNVWKGGPNFQLRDKNVFDLNLTGKKVPDFVEIGQNYTFTVELGDFTSNTCLYEVDPVETKAR